MRYHLLDGFAAKPTPTNRFNLTATLQKTATRSGPVDPFCEDGVCTLINKTQNDSIGSSEAHRTQRRSDHLSARISLESGSLVGVEILLHNPFRLPPIWFAMVTGQINLSGNGIRNV